MIILQASNISKAFADREIFQGLNLTIQKNEKLGLLGVNGSGKTTLLKILSGELEPDQGEVFQAAALKMAYLEQMNTLNSGKTIWEKVMEHFADLLELRKKLRELEQQMADKQGANLEKLMENYARCMQEYENADGYACESMATGILLGLGFAQEEFQRAVDKLSGGQKTRLNMACLLATQPDLLILDEPTNHLDMQAVEWLEEYLRTYNGTVLLVSHDRMFLDRFATRIIELRAGKLKSFPGNYQHYLVQRAQEDQAQQKAYEKQKEYIDKTEAYINRFKAGIKSKQARGRQSQLNRLERLTAPEQELQVRVKEMKISQPSGYEVLKIEGLSHAFREQVLFKDVDLHIKKGEKIALLGPNGSGKTTLLKIIMGKEIADLGQITWGSRVRVGYFSQEFEDLNPENNLFAEISNDFSLNDEEVRNCLGSMLFSNDDVFKQVSQLSGGEKGRLAFLKILLSGANLLLLDEPTNHMDLQTRQIIENILQDFAGTILVVSHDRYFIDQIVDRVVAIEDTQLVSYAGNYSYYREKRQEKIALSKDTKENSKKQARENIQAEKERVKAQERQKKKLLQNISEYEEKISRWEERKAELEEVLADPATYNDNEKAQDLTREYNCITKELEKALEEWEQLYEQI